MMPLEETMVPLRAPRYTMYYETLAFVDMDITNAAFKMQVRNDWNGGTLLLDLSTAATSTATGLRTATVLFDTIENHIIAGNMTGLPTGRSLDEMVYVSTVTIRVPKATMAALPLPEERSDDYEAVYDIWITPLGGIEQRYLRGPFIIEAGSTQ